MHKKITLHNIKYLSGFTLMEVMVALLILSIGLLGIAALQAKSLKINHGAYQRTQAIFLAYDMMDRLRANRTAALAGDCNISMGATLSGTELCDTDVTEWQIDYVQAFLPEGQGEINCNQASKVCIVTVQWDEEHVQSDEEHQRRGKLKWSITGDM